MAVLLVAGPSVAAAQELIALGPTPLTNCYTAKEMYGTEVGARPVVGRPAVPGALTSFRCVRY